MEPLDIKFDIDRFMEAAGRVDLSDICWEDVPKYPLTPEALRVVRYFMTTESATFFYLKAMMATKTAMTEPDFAPFLCAWAFEEEYHGRAFARFMEAYGEPPPKRFRSNMYGERTIGERIDEFGATAIAMCAPDAFPATHMVWGAINELTVHTAYGELIERTQHPILKVISERIRKQELKHFAFYYQQAKARFERSNTAQRLAKAVLKLAWTPVGDGMNDKSEVHHVLQFLFDGADGDAIAMIEKRIQQLPGMEWFDLFSRYLVENNIRKAPESWFAHPHGARQSGVDVFRTLH